MIEGTVKFFNNDKGYGFITSNESGEDIFVHHTGLVDEITEDDKVNYDEKMGQKGMNAVNVELV
ncbi:cold-shock DNA-binding protein family [Tangfeifania diversioriginum]|uniref:Cold-shock DNA-binding protein family n=1 Tax=Tangfeifania diversioriginum TaxID=1168035 RepID=A0A1M6EKW1_9BACT|nr:cold shock domain-containing protein [Tangfeifania diversioriginum]SHI86036.1 cold-shock DNA-binding protein family [Tangfeifania diversioriginum]